MTDRDSFDEGSDDCGDFTASEDDWKPEGEQSSSTENESGEEGPVVCDVPVRKKLSSGHNSANRSVSIGQKRKLQSLRTKMFNKYKPPPKPFSSPSNQSISDKLSAVLESSHFKKKKSISSSQTAEDSDSSGDDYLVNPKEIDLKSSFFDVTEDKKFSEEPPNFDCNAGMRLSDSEDDEFEDVDNKDAAEEKTAVQEGSGTTSNSAFQHLHEFAMKMESAKKHLKGLKSETKKAEPVVDVSQLLAMGEAEVKIGTVEPKKRKRIADSDSDWEEVQDFKHTPSATVSKEGIQFTVQLHQERSREQKTQDEVEAALKRKLNRIIKENQIYFHKVSLLCHIAHGIYSNKVLNNPTLMAQSLKLLPNKTCYPNGRTEIKYFESIVKWFKTAVAVKSDIMYSSFRTRPILPLSLALQIRSKVAICKKDFVLIFIILLRAMGIQCRMVINLVPLAIRPPQSDLCRITMKKNDNSAKKMKNESIVKGKQKQNEKKLTVEKEKAAGKAKLTNESDAKPKRGKNSSTSQKTVNEDRDIPSTSKEAILATNTIVKATTSSRAKKKVKQDDVKEEIAEKSSSTNINLRSKVESQCNKPVKKLLNKLSEIKETNQGPSTSSHFSKRNANLKEGESAKVVLTRSAKSKAKQKVISDTKLEAIPQLDGADNVPSKGGRKLRAKIAKPVKVSSDSEEEFIPSPPKRKKTTATANKANTQKSAKRDRRVLSTDIEDAVDKKSKKSPMDIWIEVFSEEEDQWVTVDLFNGKIHCVEAIRKAATTPVAYVLAWNNDNTIKDVSARYCPQWHTATRKLRVEQEWLDEALEKYVNKEKSARDKKEDRELHRLHLDKPLPTTISEYKNHPLYVIERHLLKFEAIYPPNSVTLGFVRGEPVYARECVHTLHSRDIWLKQARTVKLGEKPYKIVKARPKWDRLTNTVIKDQPLEIFGYWQTKQYEPPTAENGMVPRNAYGNVELFKKCMLPKKTVHLQLPGLNKVCKRLNIDCAPAVVGFDFHQGMCHPLMDGFVVCEEFQDQVVAAWHQEQEEAERREEEKYLQRVYGNWKKLIRGLLIREKLKKKYNFKGVEYEEKTKIKRSKKKS